MVSASAAVSRQAILEGSSAPTGAADLGIGADIATTSSQFLGLGQHVHAGVNEWLTIRNSHREIFRWLLFSRCDGCHGSGVSQSSRRDGVHKRQYRGDWNFCGGLWIFATRAANQRRSWEMLSLAKRYALL